MGGLRRWGNRLVAAAVLAVSLPAISAAARLRRGSPRRVASAAIRLACRLTGVRIVVTRPASGTVAGVREGPRVFVANHSSPLDIAAVLTACPAATFVAGADLFRIPLLSGAMRGLGTVPVDRRGRGRGPVQLRIPPPHVTDALSLVVFPEGGIAPVGRRMPFRHSAFAVAIELSATVVPVAIHHASRVLPPRGRLGIRPGTVVVELLEPISTEGLTVDDRGALASVAEERILRALTADDGGSRCPSLPLTEQAHRLTEPPAH